MVDWSQIKPEEALLDEDITTIGGHFTKAIRGNDNQVYSLGVSYTQNRLVTDATIARLNLVSGVFAKEQSPTYTLFTPFNDRFTSAAIDDLDNILAVGHGIQTTDGRRTDVGIAVRLDANLQKLSDKRKNILTLDGLIIQDVVFNPRRRVYALLCNSVSGACLLEVDYSLKKSRQLNLKLGFGEKLILAKDGTCDYIVALTVPSRGLHIVRFSNELEYITDVSYGKTPVASPNMIWHDDFGLIVIGSHPIDNDDNELILDLACLEPSDLSFNSHGDKFPFGIPLDRKSDRYGLSVSSNGSIIVSCVPRQEKVHSIIYFDSKDDSTYSNKCSYPENIIEDVVALDDFAAAVGRASVSDDGNVRPLIERFAYN